MRRFIGIGCAVFLYVVWVVVLVMRPGGEFHAETDFMRKTPFFSVLRSTEAVHRSDGEVFAPAQAGAVFDIILPSRFLSVSVYISCTTHCPGEVGLYDGARGAYQRIEAVSDAGGVSVVLDSELATQNGRKFTLSIDGGVGLSSVEVIARKPPVTLAVAWEKIRQFIMTRISWGV